MLGYPYQGHRKMFFARGVVLTCGCDITATPHKIMRSGSGFRKSSHPKPRGAAAPLAPPGASYAPAYYPVCTCTCMVANGYVFGSPYYPACTCTCTCMVSMLLCPVVEQKVPMQVLKE